MIIQGQQNKGAHMPNDWTGWEYLVGDWEGGDLNDPHQGYGVFSFGFELNGTILVRKNRTIFPTTPEREGYTHDDLLVIYTEFSGRKRGIYFDNEGHVIHYEVKVDPDQKDIILESDPAPSGPQFRFSYTQISQDTLSARFEIAPPGQPGEFTSYLEGTAKRKVL
jgi:hypothetical protein